MQLLVRDVLAHEAPADAPAAELVDDLFARAEEILAGGEYAGIADAEAFHTKLAGVTFEGRQDVARRASPPGTPLRLVRQPDNPHDANACALFDPRGDAGRLLQPPPRRGARAGARRRRRATTSR